MNVTRTKSHANIAREKRALKLLRADIECGTIARTAMRLNVSRTSIQKWKSGRFRPNTSAVAKIEQTLGITDAAVQRIVAAPDQPLSKPKRSRRRSIMKAKTSSVRELHAAFLASEAEISHQRRLIVNDDGVLRKELSVRSRQLLRTSIERSLRALVDMMTANRKSRAV